MIGHCSLCDEYEVLEHHHIFGGALRKKSEKYGLVVYLCHRCHNEPPNGVHHNRETRRVVQVYGQLKAMREQGWTVEDFRREFYKNYLEDNE